MTLYGVVLIAVLVITGGAIAFIGDRLGTKIGKKKLSIFGLRPRHTSIVITIVTGILITTLTFGIMAAASENVRLALFGMEKLNREMRQTQQQLSEASSELADANAARDKAKDDLAKARADVDRLKQRQDGLTRRNAGLEDANSSLTASNAALENGNAELAAHNEALQTEKETLDQRNAALNAANDQLAGDNAALEQRNSDLRAGLQMVREGDIVYQSGEVIASGVVKKAVDRQTLNAEIASIVYLANRNIAQKIGTKAPDQGIWIYPPEYEEALAALEKAPYDMVVRIVAAGNLVRGEPIRTSLQLYPNRTIYQENQLVYAERFTLAGQGDAAAENYVVAFLKNVNAAAVKQGILPDPLRGSVGVIEGVQFYDIVAALAPVRGDVLLSAYAAQATEALGPLRLRIKLEKFSPQQKEE